MQLNSANFELTNVLRVVGTCCRLKIKYSPICKPKKPRSQTTSTTLAGPRPNHLHNAPRRKSHAKCRAQGLSVCHSSLGVPHQMELYLERSSEAVSKTHMSAGHTQFNSIKSRHTPHPKARWINGENRRGRQFDLVGMLNRLTT